MIVLIAFFSRFKFDQELSDLKTRIDEKSNIVQTLLPIEYNIRNLQAHINLISGLGENRTLYLEILNELEKSTENQVTIYNLTFNQSQLSIKGNCQNNYLLNQFLTYVRNNERFSQITLDNVGINKDKSFDFQLSLQVQ